eukprot:6172315-Pleurochrysis_carterae.AAC.2
MGSRHSKTTLAGLSPRPARAARHQSRARQLDDKTVITDEISTVGDAGRSCIMTGSQIKDDGTRSYELAHAVVVNDVHQTDI